MDDYPNDADGDVLRRLSDAKFDFSSPVEVELYCYAEDLKTANAIRAIMNEVGFEADVFDDDDTVSVYFKKRMLLTYDAIIGEQMIANQRLSGFNTRCDGWMVGHSPKD